MFPVSYLIDGSKLTQEDIDKCLEYANFCQDSIGVVVEFLVYGTNIISLKSESKFLQIINYPTKLEAFHIALASASSVWVVVTNLHNILNDQAGDITKLMTNQNSGHVILPVKHPDMANKIGIVISYSVPYVAISKAFFIETLDGYEFNINRIIDVANKKGYLELVSAPDIPHTHSVVNGILSFKYKTPSKGLEISDKLPTSKPIKSAIEFNTNIPVFIICRDRVEPLRILVDWLEGEGMKNIYFINNASTYPLLIEYFHNSPHHIINLNLINAGHVSPWTQGVINIFADNQPYIVTDPDILPADTAKGAVQHFINLLNKYSNFVKVGFGLKIDDIPDYYEPRQSVIEWEKKFWQVPVEKDVYDADIDTTFAIYRPGTPYVLGPSLRTGGKFVARHEPWYTDSSNVSEELAYYRSHADKQIGSWGTNSSDTSKTYSGLETSKQ